MPRVFTILLVDDEPLMCEILSFELALAGFRVLTTDSGDSAFELCLNNDIDCVISDIRMFGSSGFTLVKNLRLSTKSWLPVILMTGFSDHEADDFMSLGNIELFSKPFSPSDLIMRVQQLLNEDRAAS